jgi:hypothetical protein
MNHCRVLIVSDHPLFAEGVVRLLGDQAGLQVVGVLSAEEAVVNIFNHNPDVVIVDTDRANQMLLLRMLRENPGTKFIGLSLDDNDINLYYQRSKKTTGVEALVEAIREPLEWKPPERRLRLLVVTQDVYGQRIADNIRESAPDHWIVQQWAVPQALLSTPNPGELLPPMLPAFELIVSLGQSPVVAQMLPDIARMTGAQGIIAPIDDEAWLPQALAQQLCSTLKQIGVSCVFPKPFCTLTEARYNIQGQEVEFTDGPIREFASFYGRPALKISIDAQTRAVQVDVLRDGPCGCARYVAQQLTGLPADQIEQQAHDLQKRFPCLASSTPDSSYGVPLIQIANQILQDAIFHPLELSAMLPMFVQPTEPLASNVATNVA